MKQTMFLLATLFATPLLTQCIVVDETGNPATTSAANVSGSAARSESVYDRGYQKGLQDGRSGASRTPSRYAGTYPYGESDAFNIGYEKGYNQGIR